MPRSAAPVMSLTGHGRIDGGRTNHTTRTQRVPHDWRSRLPAPATYYAEHVHGLGRPNGAGWAQGKCLFHDDSTESLSVQIGDARGGWRCFAGCGHGDLIEFHRRVTGLSFVDAVRDLIGARS